MKTIVVFLLAVLLYSTTSLYGQCRLQGMVNDSTTRLPIPGVTVYIPELHTGAVSAEDGTYAIVNLPNGNFTIQLSSIGYETSIQHLIIRSADVRLDASLSRTEIETEEIVVYGTHHSALSETPKSIVSMNQELMRDRGSMNLSDAVSKIPGINQLSTGNGISKPVIRGLYGNRIQTVLMGIRFDNQQWQDEHGLGLTDAGVERVEVIKGPAALEYGSEAMGGVLNIIEEKPAEVGKTEGDVGLQLFSNTFGVTLDAGLKGASEKMNWRIRVGAVSHGDYYDGNDDRVYNSRFDSYSAKLGLGWKKGNWLSVNNYMFSFSRFGFILEANMKVDTTQSRFGRDFSGPHHAVLFNILTSENTIFKTNSKIKINLGAHINNRQEQEGGNKISLDMVLNTYNANLQWAHFIGEHSEWNAGGQIMYQTNRNLGSRQIVPDANLLESGLFGYWKETLNKFVIEGGVRYDVKNVHTFETGSINTSGSEVQPFNKWYNTVNGSAGVSLNPSTSWNFKLNLSSGYRAPNLAELSSNGVHEGTLRFEIGDPDMKVEQNINAELAGGFDNKQISAGASAYYNHFFNYIYLNPTDAEYFGFQIYQYLQKDATLSGGEAYLDIHPDALSWLDLNFSYALVRGKTDDGEYLPFIPADKFRGEVTIELLKSSAKWKQTFVRVGSDYVFKQNHFGQFETETPSYFLVDAAVGTHIHFYRQQLTITLGCTNLLNEVYFDHLSRFKYFDIYNMGRNVYLNILLPFN